MEIDPRLFESADQKLRFRNQVNDKYTYRKNNITTKPARVLSPRYQRISRMPVLGIKTDVNEKIGIVEKTKAVRSPRSVHRCIHKEIQDSDFRLKRIKNGCPLIRAIDAPVELIPIQEPKKINILTEEQSLKPIRGFQAPQMTREDAFHFPDENQEFSTGEKALNSVVGVKHYINESDREQANRVVQEINRRNSRRKKALQSEYEDYIKYGLKEANRRAQRSARLSALKCKRKEQWWNNFLAEFKPEVKSRDDIDFLEQISQIDLFEEGDIVMLVRIARENRRNVTLLHQILRKANGYGKFINPARLGVIFNPKPSAIELVSLRSFASLHELQKNL